MKAESRRPLSMTGSNKQHPISSVKATFSGIFFLASALAQGDERSLKGRSNANAAGSLALSKKFRVVDDARVVGIQLAEVFRRCL